LEDLGLIILKLMSCFSGMRMVNESILDLV